MHESWRRMQVPIIGVVGILLIFMAVAWKVGALPGAPEEGLRGYADIMPLDVMHGERCDATFYDPVCCSDGNTYDNLCLCQAAGNVAEYQGTCR